MRRVGIVCSTGGAAFLAAYDLLTLVGRSPDCVVVTDRPCGVEFAAEARGIQWARISDDSREGFSSRAAGWLYQEAGVEWTCLFFTRIVSPSLFRRGPCVNIHPSLLPAYPGMAAVRQALRDGARFLGATAHFTNEYIDGGPRLAQVCACIPPGCDEILAERISFGQKVYLFLLMCGMSDHAWFRQAFPPQIQTGASVTPWASPSLEDPELEIAFQDFLNFQGIPWLR